MKVNLSNLALFPIYKTGKNQKRKSGIPTGLIGFTGLINATGVNDILGSRDGGGFPISVDAAYTALSRKNHPRPHFFMTFMATKPGGGDGGYKCTEDITPPPLIKDPAPTLQALLHSL